MSDLLLPGGPGLRAAKTSVPRRSLLTSVVKYLPSGVLVSGTYARDPGNTGDVNVLRPGQLMGKRTSGGLYAPSFFGVTTNAEAIGSTTIEAAASVITELVRRVGATGTFVLRGPNTANGVIDYETVTYSAASGTSITVTAITKNYVAGSFIQPTDGSQYPLSLIPDGSGLLVTDSDGTDLSAEWPDVPIMGVVDSSQLLLGNASWPTDTSLEAWIESQLNQAGKFVLDHAFVP